MPTTTPAFDPGSWPASWVLALIAKNQLHSFYISRRWLRVRAWVLRQQHGECQDCAAKGKAGITASVVHHEQPLRRRPDLALSPQDASGKQQLTALCESCHWRRHHKANPPLTKERW